MFKKYDHRLVKSYKSYTLQEICRLYNADQLHIQTIRVWINNGELNHFEDGNKYLIYGAVLKEFLFIRNKSKGRTLQFIEFLCCKCKQINRPLEATILSAAIKKNGSILATAMCPNCAFEMNRLYKCSEIDKIFTSFQIEAEALRVLSDTSSSASNTHLKANHQIHGSESRPIEQCTDQEFSRSTSTECRNSMNRIDKRHNPNNEIVKRKFFEQLEHARNGKDPKTVDQYIKALHELLWLMHIQMQYLIMLNEV